MDPGAGVLSAITIVRQSPDGQGSKPEAVSKTCQRTGSTARVGFKFGFLLGGVSCFLRSEQNPGIRIRSERRWKRHTGRRLSNAGRFGRTRLGSVDQERWKVASEISQEMEPMTVRLALWAKTIFRQPRSTSGYLAIRMGAPAGGTGT